MPFFSKSKNTEIKIRQTNTNAEKYKISNLTSEYVEILLTDRKITHNHTPDLPVNSTVS